MSGEKIEGEKGFRLEVRTCGDMTAEAAACIARAVQGALDTARNNQNIRAVEFNYDPRRAAPLYETIMGSPAKIKDESIIFASGAKPSTPFADEQDTALYEQTGKVEDANKLVAFLFLLLRDEVTPGRLERFYKEIHALEGPIHFSNGYLAQYARNLAERLQPKVEEVELSVWPSLADVEEMADALLRDTEEMLTLDAACREAQRIGRPGRTELRDIIFPVLVSVRAAYLRAKKPIRAEEG